MPTSMDPGALASNLLAAADMTVTTSPVACPSCAARSSEGVIAYAHDDNDPSSTIRVATNADATHGIPLKPGRSFAFKVDNAADLKACLESAVDGGSVLILMPV